MGPQMVAWLVTLAVLLVPVGAWLGTRATRRELADEQVILARWAAALDRRDADLRRREYLLAHAGSRR